MARQQLFNVIAITSVFEAIKRDIANEISNYNAERFLAAGDDNLIKYFVEKSTLKPLKFLTENKYLLDKPQEVNATGYRYEFGDRIATTEKLLKFTLCIPFEGDLALFNYKPRTCRLNLSRQMNAEMKGSELLLHYEEKVTKAEQIEQLFTEDISLIQTNVDNLARDIQPFNDELVGFISANVAERKTQVLANQSVIDSLTIPIKRRDDLPTTYTIPEVRKKTKIEFTSVSYNTKPEPTLAEGEYENILTIIKDMSLAMERSPQTFVKLKEPEIRDFFVILLNGHYQGNATAETFNGEGKTDILIRYQNANAFIGECKFWKGKKSLLETIVQLLGYVTWRDTKTAIILFHKGKGLSDVLGQVDTIMKSHPNYKCSHKLKSADLQGDTIFSYIFTNPTDNEKELILSVLVYQVTS